VSDILSSLTSKKALSAQGSALVEKALRNLCSAALRKIPLFERSEFGIF
jgi:hypothetical protein